MCLMAAAQHAPAQAVAARKTAQTAVTARYGVVRVGVRHKRNLLLRVAATAERKQELALLLAAAAVADRGARVRGKLVPPQQNPQQAKPAVIAAAKQELLHVIPIQAAGQQAAGELAEAQGSVLLAQHNHVEWAGHKPAHQAAHGAAAAGKIALQQVNLRQVKLAVIVI